MRLTRLVVENFRSIRSADVPLCPFVCAVGHNNSGKSSLLMAMSLFVSGNKLRPADFYDSNEDVVFTVTIEGITDDVLNRLADIHRQRIEQLAVDESLTLVRRYATSGQTTLRCHRLVPKDTRFREENLAQVIKGSGKALRESVLEAFPELDEPAKTATIRTQADFRELN